MGENSPSFRTSRFLLRKPEETDIDEIIKYFKRNRDHLLPTDPPKPTEYYTEAFWLLRLQKFRKETEEGRSLRFFIFGPTKVAQIIGNISFTDMCRGPLQACRLGYSLDQEFQGQGIMTESLTLAIRHVFENLNFHRITADHLPDNERSANVLKRLKFSREGLALNYLYINGKWRDHVLNALTNENWKNEF